MKELSIIVITWNAEQFVSDCIRSVIESTEGIDREIIVIDNGSKDNTVGIIRQFTQSCEDITFLTNDTNLGVAKARNIGMRKASARYVWLLDVDTVVNREAVDAMLSFMNSHPSCGICGCKLMNSLGEIQDSCRKYPWLHYKVYNVLYSLLSRFAWAGSLATKINERNQSQFYWEKMQQHVPFEAEYIIGACQMIRSELIPEVGFLDENIFYGPEDADYCLRTHLKGWQIFYLPQVHFIHEYQRITNKRLFTRMSLIHAKSLLYFYRKHRGFRKNG